jgi:alkylation response protein AidB-like acyl-CoA dehydrogenase
VTIGNSYAAIPGLSSAEQLHWTTVARQFGDDFVAPRAGELDAAADPRDCWSWDIVEAADRLGLRTLTLASEYGGPEVDTQTAAAVVQELCRADLGVGVVISQNLKLIRMLQEGANADQRSRYLPLIAKDPRCILAIGATERTRGSDNFLPYDGLDSPFGTTAARVPGGWKLNGIKQFISNGPTSSLYFVIAQTDTDVPVTAGSTAFLLTRDTSGFDIGRIHNKLGERLVNNSELIFTDCFIPDADVFGEPGGAFPLLAGLTQASNLFAAASVLGCADACYDQAVKWTRSRIQGGRKLIEHDTVATELAEMRMQLEAARAYIRHVAWACDHLDSWEPTMSCLPKVFASQVAWEIATRAMELHGGYGFMREGDTGMEKLLRDASTFLHSDGTNRVLLSRAGKLIRGDSFTATPV